LPGTRFDDLFEKYSEISGVPQAVIEAVARTESSLNPNLIGDEGNSFGLFQIYKPTARMLGFGGDWSKLLDPEMSTELATRYMAEIIDHQGGLSLNSFYSEYNSGKPELWQTSSEVFQHVQNFLANYALSVSPGDAAGAGIFLLIALGLLIKYFPRKHP